MLLIIKKICFIQVLELMKNPLVCPCVKSWLEKWELKQGRKFVPDAFKCNGEGPNHLFHIGDPCMALTQTFPGTYMYVLVIASHNVE